MQHKEWVIRVGAGGGSEEWVGGWGGVRVGCPIGMLYQEAGE